MLCRFFPGRSKTRKPKVCLANPRPEKASASWWRQIIELTTEWTRLSPFGKGYADREGACLDLYNSIKYGTDGAAKIL